MESSFDFQQTNSSSTFTRAGQNEETQEIFSVDLDFPKRSGKCLGVGPQRENLKQKESVRVRETPGRLFDGEKRLADAEHNIKKI